MIDVCVVGGAGHVGAPLSIVLANAGLRSLIYDVDRDAMALLRAGTMPFLDEGSEALLAAALERDMLRFSADVASVGQARIIVVAIRTPIDEFHNPRLNVITRCIDDLLPYLTDAHTIVLRSTVFPGVTEFVDEYLRGRGKRPRVAFCPERVVQGRAVDELRTLPQIVSGTTPEAEDIASGLFARIAPSIIRMRPKEAEFAKLLTNAYRYIQFAAANQFYMMTSAAGVDHERVVAGVKTDYLRMRDFPGPGFAAGPCLMKDTMQLAAFSNMNFPLGMAAMTINEGLPSFLVERLRLRHDLRTKTVGILGMAFKADIDDIRESLSFKLAKILRFAGATVLCSDEHAKVTGLVPADELLGRSDIVIVAVPHAAYRGLHVPAGVEVVDLWGVLRPARTDAQPPRVEQPVG